MLSHSTFSVSHCKRSIFEENGFELVIFCSDSGTFSSKWEPLAPERAKKEPPGLNAFSVPLESAHLSSNAPIALISTSVAISSGKLVFPSRKSVLASSDRSGDVLALRVADRKVASDFRRLAKLSSMLVRFSLLKEAFRSAPGTFRSREASTNEISGLVTNGLDLPLVEVVLFASKTDELA